MGLQVVRDERLYVRNGGTHMKWVVRLYGKRFLVGYAPSHMKRVFRLYGKGFVVSYAASHMKTGFEISREEIPCQVGS